MKNLLLNWKWFNEDGTPGTFMWAICTIAAVVVFATIIFLIYRLYGRNLRNKKNQAQQGETIVNNVSVVSPTFEKRDDNQQLEFYDPTKAQQEAAEIKRKEEEMKRQEEERLQGLMLEEERKRKELELKEREFEEKRQREEEVRLERERKAEERIAEKERLAEERIAEKERIRAEKEAAKIAKTGNNQNDEVNNFFMDDDNSSAFTFGQEDNANDAVDFWNQAQTTNEVKPEPIITPAPVFGTESATDPRMEKLMAELEDQKQTEQERFANLMAELEKQKQETARLQDELQDKKRSEDLINQAKKEMEQMIKDSQESMKNIEKTEKKNKEDKDLLEEIKNVLAAEREAQEQRLREQENSLAAVLNAMENERRVKEENAMYAEQEAKKEDEFVKMQNQYQDAIKQMQAKFQQMLDESNAQKQSMYQNAGEIETPNVYQMQLERERAETASLIEQMQHEVDRMNAEREAERRKYEEKQKALDVTLAEALQTQRNEFEQAQQRVAEANAANVDKILKDIERQRSQEQEMFNNILNELVAEREDNNQAKAALEQMVRDSEARIQQLENQTMPRGLDEDSINSLKEVLAVEREEQFKRMEEYKNEIANLRDIIAAEHEQKNANDESGDSDANQVTYTARDSEVDAEMKARMDAMQSEIQYLNELREAEHAESEKRHAELLEALNHSILTGENAKNPETQQVEKESVERILTAERDRLDDIMAELAESREDTRKAQMAMQQLIEENADLINRLNDKKESHGIDEETMAALKELLNHERDMQEKRLAEHEDRLNMAVSVMEDQKQNQVDEQNRNAEYEQLINDMRQQYEAEINALRDAMNQPVEEKQVEDNDVNREVQSNQDNETNKEVLAQLERLQANITALENSRNDEKAQLEETLKVQRLEMELEKEREINELKIQQALEAQRREIESAKDQELAAQLEALQIAKEQELAAQREEIEAVKAKELEAQRQEIELAKQQELEAQRETIAVETEQALAEQRAVLEPNVNEQANEIIATFKEEMNRQYEQFLNLLNEKKMEAETAQKEYDELVEQSSPEDQAALKEQFDVQEMMEQLREERKAAREEAQALREELEAQRMETEAKLMKQLSEVKEGLVSELSSELEIKEKFDAMEREIEAHNQEKLKQNEEEEARIKQEYEEFKQRIADEVVALEEKNAALQAELEMARAEKTSNDEAKQAEYEENEKRLREKYMQLRNELMKEAEQVTKQSEEIAAEKQVIEDKKKDLEEEKARLQNEVAMLKQQVLEIKTQDNEQAGGVVTEEQLAEVRASLEAEYQQREKEMLDKLEAEKQSLVAREAQLKMKETAIEQEEERIREQSKAVTTMITNREYTKEERERLVLDYSLKLQDLEERLRQNEKALRENNREFIPLRRIKNTLDRDLRLLRKREAIVAKQEVLVYGVNNISTVDPERIKKLEQDIKQLTGLQQSVANCETILNKNKDRYPTLENLDRVLRAQNEQIRHDLEEVKSAMAMFGENENAEGEAQA